MVLDRGWRGVGSDCRSPSLSILAVLDRLRTSTLSAELISLPLRERFEQAGETSDNFPSTGGPHDVSHVLENAQHQQPVFQKDPQSQSTDDSGPNEAEDVVVLNSAGSTVGSVSSDASLGGIATVLSSCCIHPRGQWSIASQETGQSSGNASAIE